jgi:ECF transporter S component (folate family)
MAMFYGPLMAGFAAAIADFVGVMLFPPPVGNFFPGFTLTAFLIGIIYGLFLKKRPIKFWRICVAALIVTLGLNFVLDSIWLYIILDSGVFALLPARIVRTLIMFPVQVICIHFVASERFVAVLDAQVSKF